MVLTGDALMATGLEKFKGSTVFVHENSRTELPIKKADEVVPVWKIISKFIGQDLTRVSLPVVMNEPLSALQKFAEMVILAEEQLRVAAVTENSLERLARFAAGFVVFYSAAKIRKRKPFNPMLGETYELVTKKFRFLSEKVAHVPLNIMTTSMEGENYVVNGYHKPKPQFSMNGTKGMIKMNLNGQWDVYFDKFDEHVTMTRPFLEFKNIIWGGVYVDVEGVVEAVNHKTGDRVELVFKPK